MNNSPYFFILALLKHERTYVYINQTLQKRAVPTLIDNKLMKMATSIDFKYVDGKKTSASVWNEN